MLAMPERTEMGSPGDEIPRRIRVSTVPISYFLVADFLSFEGIITGREHIPSFLLSDDERSSL
jgi:hypothetical protein